MNSNELQNRLKNFAYRIVTLAETLPKNRTALIIENQLLRSVFSAAANYRAACKAQTHKGFIAKLSISFEEMDETLFWLEAILASSRKTSQNRAKTNLQYTV